MNGKFICPQCLMFWEEDIGKCPCAVSPLTPPFVTKLDRFLASSNLDHLQWYFEDYFYPNNKQYKTPVLAQFPILKKIKEENLELLKQKFGEVR